MKVGLIFECGPTGADKVVCELLARRLNHTIQIKSVTLDNKQNLLIQCGQAASGLFQEGYERVVIVWDLYPPWRKKGAKPCRKEDRQAIARSLQKAKVKSKPVYLVCIEEELEAWLISDGRALSTVLSRPAHPVRVKDTSNPEQIRAPKTRLNKLFQQHRRQPYVDRFHAEKIVRAMPNLNRIRCCATFVRFAIKATGVTPQ